MKKKKAFTLIELLAVIIVLAIIALIAVPIIFNLIENAKIKSLENSCYGVIDAVKTNYAENLLNSEDGTVKLKGNVKDLTLSGEHPIKGTWEIDNSSNSTDRGIKIKNVKFASMIDYTCTNVNSDGTINSKVMCTKDGEKSKNEEISYGIDVIVDFDINGENCVTWAMSNGFATSEEEANELCTGSYSSEVKLMILTNQLGAVGLSLSDLLDDEVIINDVYYNEEKTCFEYPIETITFDINELKCKSFISKFAGYTGDELETAVVETCNEDTLTELISYGLKSALEYHEVIDNIEVTYDKTSISKYNCGVNNWYGLPEITNVVLPSEVMTIGENAFQSAGITSVDFSETKDLTTIDKWAFANNQISSLDLSGLTYLETIDYNAFISNQISSLDLSGLTNLKTIDGGAFSNNQISILDLSGLTSLETIDYYAFNSNQISDLELNGLTSLKTIGNAAFQDNPITKLSLIDLPKLDLTELNYINIKNFGVDNKQLEIINLINLPNLETIGDSAFSSNQISSLNLSSLSNLKTIGVSAFGYNQISSLDLSGLTNLTTIGNNTFSSNQISSLDLSGLTNLTTIDYGAFASNQISSLDLSGLPSLETIGEWAFAFNQIDNLNLSNLSSLTTIENNAFENSKITSIKIPNSVTAMGTNAFAYNWNLTSIEIDNYEGAIEGSPWGAENATITYLR